MPSIPGDPITFTCALEARRETVYFLAKLIHEHGEQTGTRRGTRALGPFRHAVLVLRWFLDATHVRQLAADNQIGKSTCYDRLHGAIDLLAALAPDVYEAILAASAAGATRLYLDGTLIRVRREALCCIPAAGGGNSEGGFWVTRRTWRWKPKGTTACRESGGRLEAFRTGCRKTRATWPRLDCLKPNPQRYKGLPAGMTHVTGGTSCSGMCGWLGHLPWRVASPSEGGQGDEWAAYIVLDTYSEDVPRDHLQGASPKVTERP